MSKMSICNYYKRYSLRGILSKTVCAICSSIFNYDIKFLILYELDIADLYEGSSVGDCIFRRLTLEDFIIAEDYYPSLKNKMNYLKEIFENADKYMFFGVFKDKVLAAYG